MQENSVEEGNGGKRVLFVYALPTRHEFQKFEEGAVPSHRLWGAEELRGQGWRVEYCPDAVGWWSRLGEKGWRLWQGLWAIRQSRESLGVVAVHEVSAAILLVARRVGVLRAPVVIINMALLHRRNLCGSRLLVWRWLLRGVGAVVSLVEAQCEQVVQHFGVSWARSHFLPLGVDASFGGLADPSVEERFCLAVGTNDGKDFQTLVDAFPLGERLIVVTDTFNAAKVLSHPRFGAGIEVRTAVPALELRELYRKAAVVVVPLADTSHGSGHTVLLETMALGKLIIVTASRNMKGYIEDWGHVVAVPVGDVDALRAALLDLLSSPSRHSAMRERAAQVARQKFNMERFGRGIGRVLEGLQTGLPLAGDSPSRSVAEGGNELDGVGLNKPTGEKKHASVS